MGCICSFFKTLTSYHGSHLTAHQVSRQRQQRQRKPRSPPPMTPEKEPPQPKPQPGSFNAPSLKPPGFKGPSEEDRLLNFSPQKHKLGECKQSSKFGASFSKS